VSDIEDDIVYARAHVGVRSGTLVHVTRAGDRILYAGPILGAPPSGQRDTLVLLSPDDFARLKAAAVRRRN
jgi:hypothetical protein